MKKRYLVASIIMLVAVITLTIMGSATLIDDVDVMSLSAENIYPLEGVENENIETSNSGDFVYLGGKPLGIDVKSIGLIIMSKQEVITENGAVMPCKDIELYTGDRLISIDDIRVMSENDVRDMIADKDMVRLKIEHEGKYSEYDIKLAIDALTRTKRLGLWLKDGVTGIGTLTYISPNRRYGALGHPIEKDRVYRGGNIYNAHIKGCIKGERGKAGELNGVIVNNRAIGTIDKNTDYGIFGTYIGDLSGFKRVEVASRNDVRPGRAHIYTTINGSTPQCYEIEIIKRSMQSNPDTKGMVIRITDKRLLKETNGILQGMSGSPIIQNNKLIGAVTHVFINDPTKGFGVYSDFMIGN